MQAMCNLSLHDVNEFTEKNKGGRYLQRMKKDPSGTGLFRDGLFVSVTVGHLLAQKGSIQHSIQPKIHQTKIFVTFQRFGNLFLFGLVLQYSTNQNQYNKGRFKVMATYLQQ